MEKGKGLKKYNLISLVSTPLKAAPFASGVYLLMKAIGAVVPPDSDKTRRRLC